MSGRIICGALVLGASLLASCAPKPAPVVRLAPCDVATGTATSTSSGVALMRAERHLATQIADARGGLVSTGVRRVRVIGTRRTCEPYRVFGTGTGLVTCRVQAQLCGR